MENLWDMFIKNIKFQNKEPEKPEWGSVIGTTAIAVSRKMGTRKCNV